MSTSYGGHQIKPKIQTSTRKTVYPLPQELAEKVIKDRGRNAYVVVFDTDVNYNKSSEQKNAQRPNKEPNVETSNYKLDNQKPPRLKTGNEDVKINFSNLEFEDYDSTKTSVKVFTDDETEGDSESVVKKESLDEGYGEAENGSPQQYKKSSEPIAGYMVIPPTLSTPLSKFDLSGSSGYFSGGSGNLSEFTNTSPLPTSDQGFHHPATRQIILMQSSTLYDGSDILPHQYVNISPMSSLAAGFQNVARIDSPTVFSTKKFTGADAFSLPENSHEQGKQLSSETQVVECLPQSSTLPCSTSRSKTPPFKWEHVENRIVIQAPNKKQMDLTLPEVQVTNSKQKSQQNKQKNFKDNSALEQKTPQKIGDVVIHCDVKQKETVVMVQQGDSQNYAIGHISVSDSLDPQFRGNHMLQTSSLMPVVEHGDSNSQGFICTNPQETTGCVTYKQNSYETFLRNEKEVLDTSLTNIQWLGGIQLRNPTKADKPESTKSNHNGNSIQWKRMSTEDIVRIAAECGKTKRPPFSYMTLIQMALHSKEDKRMRLRDICAWIENTFPYYKYTAKPGWRNSIRHNLSLYSIFERETTKKHGSYWTVRDDCPEKLKSCPGRDIKKEEKVEPPAPFGGMIPVLPSFVPQSTASTSCTVTQGKKRVGPQPILPRPSPVNNGSLQTYALIPIQGVTNSTTQSQSLSMPLSSSQESTSSESSQSDSKKGKTRKIAPKLSPSLLMSPPNLLKQAWMDSQFASSSETDNELHKVHCEGNRSDNETCAKKPKTGLPQPKIYAKNTQPLRRTKSRRKQKLVPKERELMQDSSDEENEYAKFVSKLEEDLPTPVRKMLDDNVKEDESSAITSTPLKNSRLSPQLPSPFSGLTPLKSENILDSSFLECLRDSPQMAAAKKSPMSLLSPKIDFNFIGLTPIKGSSHDNSYNLSKFLAEYPLDAHMVEEADVLPVDLSALNWSSVHAHLDNS